MWGRKKEPNPEIEEAKKRRDELQANVDAAIRASRAATVDVERLQEDLLDEYKDAEEQMREDRWS